MYLHMYLSFPVYSLSLYTTSDNKKMVQWFILSVSEQFLRQVKLLLSISYVRERLQEHAAQRSTYYIMVSISASIPFDALYPNS